MRASAPTGRRTTRPAAGMPFRTQVAADNTLQIDHSAVDLELAQLIDAHSVIIRCLPSFQPLHLRSLRRHRRFIARAYAVQSTLYMLQIICWWFPLTREWFLSAYNNDGFQRDQLLATSASLQTDRSLKLHTTASIKRI